VVEEDVASSSYAGGVVSRVGGKEISLKEKEEGPLMRGG